MRKTVSCSVERPEIERGSCLDPELGLKNIELPFDAGLVELPESTQRRAFTGEYDILSRPGSSKSVNFGSLAAFVPKPAKGFCRKL